MISGKVDRIWTKLWKAKAPKGQLCYEETLRLKDRAKGSSCFLPFFNGAAQIAKQFAKQALCKIIPNL